MGKRLTPPATDPPIIQAATAAAMATTAPTEMSMPRVAITMVMPSDTSTSGAARLRMSIRLPYRWPSRHSTCRKLELKTVFTRQQQEQRDERPCQAVAKQRCQGRGKRQTCSAAINS